MQQHINFDQQIKTYAIFPRHAAFIEGDQATMNFLLNTRQQ